MLGVTHATSGAAVWIATTGVLPYLDTGLVPLPAEAVLAGSIVAAGAALLPDIDHHSATIAQSVPVVGKIVAGIAGNLSGGHRRGFHAPIVLFGVWPLASWISRLSWQTPGGFTIAAGAGLATVALSAFAVKARGYATSWGAAWFVAVLFAVAVLLMAPAGPVWLPLAVTLGYATHLVGDLLTTGGLPVLWPLPVKPPAWVHRSRVVSAVWRKGGNIAVPLLGDTGSRREKFLGVLMTSYVSFGTISEAGRLLGL